MNQDRLTKLFNNAPDGNYIRRVVLREIVMDNYLLFIESYGLIWPKKLAPDKQLSYVISSRQLLIRNESDEIVEKIMLGNITEMHPQEKVEEKLVMRLIIRNT